MQMAGDFAQSPGRLVTKDDFADRHFARDHAADGRSISNTTYNFYHAQSVPLSLQAGQLRPQSCPPQFRVDPL
jgi:hypothetical protein